jgi:uncharacterized protein (TIGR03435 family)
MTCRATRAFVIFLACAWMSKLIGADPRPSFEAATVKKVVPGDTTFIYQNGPGTNAPTIFRRQPDTLLDLMERAYGVEDYEIYGPDWIRNDRFAVTAKIPLNTDEKQFRLMLQRLLEERFHLILHHATRIVSGYALIVAKGGPKLKAIGLDPNAPPASQVVPTGKTDKAGFPVLPPGLPLLISSGDPHTVLASFRTSISIFVTQLGMMVMMSTGERPIPQVADRTGLQGNFEFKLEFAKYSDTPGLGGAAEPETGPSIFTALKEQLGLTLVRAKIDNDVIVIDSANKTPAEN